MQSGLFSILRQWFPDSQNSQNRPAAGVNPLFSGRRLAARCIYTYESGAGRAYAGLGFVLSCLASLVLTAPDAPGKKGQFEFYTLLDKLLFKVAPSKQVRLASKICSSSAKCSAVFCSLQQQGVLGQPGRLSDLFRGVAHFKRIMLEWGVPKPSIP